MRILSREQVAELEQASKKVREQKRPQAQRMLAKGYKRREVQEIVGIS